MFISYSTEKRLSKKPETFGKGAKKERLLPKHPRTQRKAEHFVPLLTLGSPGSGTTAVLLGALIMYGIRPRPQLMTEQPVLVWAVIASLYISNLILIFGLVGAFSINNSINDICWF
ncbi:tripartite tricarboxylate transporter permease [Fictibacillus sp. S7]|uniref:tripartite tricarboxylate transporter permease n=1 Tax=Fictibacillus sp. S7 TaxID=2212476 RepID=UPI0010129F03|nr:hypothetical protein DMO16_05515 [Fictibacillus sp. S7]